jgi:hypothetical protein
MFHLKKSDLFDKLNTVMGSWECLHLPKTVGVVNHNGGELKQWFATYCRTCDPPPLMKHAHPTQRSKIVSWNATTVLSRHTTRHQNPDKIGLVASECWTLHRRSYMCGLDTSITHYWQTISGRMWPSMFKLPRGHLGVARCAMKSIKQPVMATAPRPLYWLHTDIIPLPVRSCGQHKYWIIFGDEWSRWIEVVVVRLKSKYLRQVQSVITRWENEHQDKGFHVA